MATTYDAAVAELYRARLDVFVAERKRLATELKAAGDKAGAARFAKLGRPPISAWAVNQLWWQARPDFEELLAVAARLRVGERAATVVHRELLARLRMRAAALLGDAGHAATEATLRRVTATLSAIAAAGTFDPDPAGALTTDRDPPGFDALSLGAALASPASPSSIAPLPAPAEPAQAAAAREETAHVVVPAEALERRRAEQQHERAAAAERAAAERAAAERAAAERAAAERAAAERAAAAEAERAAAERRRIEAAERAKRQEERARLDGELHAVQIQAEAQRREIERLRRELADTEAGLERSLVTLAELAARRAELDSKG